MNIAINRPTAKQTLQDLTKDAATPPRSTGGQGVALCGRWEDWKDNSKPKRTRAKRLKVDQNPEPYGRRIKETKEQATERQRIHDSGMRLHSWHDRWYNNEPRAELIPNSFPGLFGFASVASASKNGEGKEKDKAEKQPRKRKSIKLANKPVKADAKTKEQADASKAALKERLNSTYAEWVPAPDQNNNRLIEIVYEYVSGQLEYYVLSGKGPWCWGSGR